MLFNNFDINLNAQQMNGMTHFSLHVNVRLLDTLNTNLKKILLVFAARNILLKVL